MTDFSILLTFVVLCIVSIKELYNRSLSIFLWASLLVFFGFSHLLQIGQYNFSKAVLFETSEFVCIFCFFYLIVRSILGVALINNLKFTNKSKYFNGKNVEKCINILYKLFLLSTFAYCISVVLYAGGIAGISKRIIYMYRANNFWLIFLNILWHATVPVTLYYLIEKRNKNVYICICCIILKSVISMTRTYLLELFVAVAMYFLFTNKRINLKKVLGSGFVGIVGIYSMYLLRGFRYYYNFSDIGVISWNDLNQKAFEFINTQSGDIFLSGFFYRLMQYGGWVEGVIPGASYLRLLMLPIPSSLSFGLKPEDICITLGSFFGQSVNNIVAYTVTPTLFGDVYANFLWFGCIIGGIIWAVIVSALDMVVFKQTNIKKILYAMLIASAYVNIGRGSVYNPFFNIFCGAIIQSVVYKASAILPKIRFIIGKK